MMRRRGAARRGSKLPRHCHPLGEAETISLWEILLIGSSRGLRPSRAHPGAERTDSPPHHPFSDSAEILRISGRGICKEAIFSPEGKPPLRKKISARGDQAKSLISLGRSQSDLPALWASNLSDAQVASLDWKSRGFTSSRALPWLFWHGFLFPTKRAILLTAFVSDGVGRSAPLLPLGRRGARGSRPSRALPGMFWRGFWFPTKQAILLRAFVSDDASVGRSAPLHPLRDGGERVHTLSRSPGAGLAGIGVFDDAGYFLRILVSDDADVGRSALLHPLGDGVREGSHPLALSRGCSGGDFGSRRCGLSFCRRRFRRRGRGALCSPTSPSGGGVREGSDPLALSRRVV